MGSKLGARPYERIVGNSREIALRQAMENFSGWLLWYFRGRCNDDHEAENRLQELWIDVYDHFPIEKMQDAGLLKRRAQQMCVDWQRKQVVRSNVEFTDTLLEQNSQPFFQEPANDKEEKALEARFWENFPNLDVSEQQKRVFWQKMRFGYTLGEIAKEMSLSESTAHDWFTLVKNQCLNILNWEDSR